MNGFSMCSTISRGRRVGFSGSIDKPSDVVVLDRHHALTGCVCERPIVVGEAIIDCNSLPSVGGSMASPLTRVLRSCNDFKIQFTIFFRETASVL